VDHIDNRGEQLRAEPPAALEICGAKVPLLRGFSQKEATAAIRRERQAKCRNIACRFPSP
jgi:hypothetical protein